MKNKSEKKYFNTFPSEKHFWKHSAPQYQTRTKGTNMLVLIQTNLKCTVDHLFHPYMFFEIKRC
jgi:hypothetical protein